jgi:hypothetical protein
MGQAMYANTGAETCAGAAGGETGAGAPDDEVVDAEIVDEGDGSTS